MDGEIASEHYAGIRYRDPEIARLYEPYVCVIASVYRHNPRDYDEQGRRILCPRFGSVTCGEHIAIEPGLFREFFDDKRIAPRHIGVELDGGEMYDVYYAFDTDSVFDAIENGISSRAVSPPTVIRSDRPIVERVASRDIADRIAVEAAYKEGDQSLRRTLLDAAMEHPEADQVDLLRLAVFGFDVDLSKKARQALAKSESEAAFKLIAEALRVPMETGERDALITALARIGESSPKARMLAVVHEGLASRSKLVDVVAWMKALDEAGPVAPEVDSAALETRIDNQTEAFQSGDPQALLELAEAFLASAYAQMEAEPTQAEYLFKDARHTALEAEKLGVYGWRTNAVIGLAEYNLGNKEAAYARAEGAVNGMPPGEPGWNAAAALGLFAEARWKAIAGAVKDQREWDAWSKAFQGTGDWLTDVHSAYSVLARHPMGIDEHAAAHYDFLNILGAKAQASRILDTGLRRFPESWGLHYRLRGRILRDKGVEGLEEVYETMLREKDASPTLEWYAGYASLVAAEFHRRRGRDGSALAAYGRGIDHYERGIEANPDSRDTADHYIAIAMAGRARLAYERGDYEAALDELLASLKRRPDAAATPDGLNITPMDTARMLMQRLKEQERKDLVEKLQAALDQLDPELLKLPAYEGEGPPRRPRQGRRPRRDR
jgi:tetratricopeptide (TPR) repeat protein